MEESIVPSAATPQRHLPPPPAPVTIAPTLREEGGAAVALAGIAHDARNLVTALGLCAELIAEPGVLAPVHRHYAAEVRSIADASERLVRRLSSLARVATLRRQTTAVETPVTDLSEAVRQLGSLLSAIAGPTIGVQIACLPCRGPLLLSEEDLTRILLNLVRNAADAMPTGGRIRITAQQGGGGSFLWTLPDDHPLTTVSAADVWGQASSSGTVLLTVEDDGPGIPPEILDRVFDPGFSTRRAGHAWPDAPHHGLGLSIVRELVEGAGGTIRAVIPPGHGARFEIEVPLTNVTGSLPSERALTGGSELR
jgi:signal transduction histidine kinase